MTRTIAVCLAAAAVLSMPATGGATSQTTQMMSNIYKADHDSKLSPAGRRGKLKTRSVPSSQKGGKTDGFNAIRRKIEQGYNR